jgi:hypothetical protein
MALPEGKNEPPPEFPAALAPDLEKASQRAKKLRAALAIAGKSIEA